MSRLKFYDLNTIQMSGEIACREYGFRSAKKNSRLTLLHEFDPNINSYRFVIIEYTYLLLKI